MSNTKLVRDLKAQGWSVTDYTLKTAQGRHVRRASVVTAPNGRKFRFLEKISLTQGVAQSLLMIAKESQ